MTHRTFVDEQGRNWEVWEVHPEVVERRLNEDRRSVPRQTADRRQHVDIRFRMPPELREGWLAFQSDNARRRLAPIPAGWERLSDDDLHRLLRVASAQPATSEYTSRPSTEGEPQQRR